MDKIVLILLLLLYMPGVAFSDDGVITSNPGATDVNTGTGALGKALGFPDGLRLEGLLISDINYLMREGKRRNVWGGNNLFQIALSVDTEKVHAWKGGAFKIEFLRFDGSPVNKEAGVVQGYNGLVGPSPLHRSELYQVWYRQELFDKRLVVRIGKMIPSIDFNNVLKPVSLLEESRVIPATSGVIYTPIFVNSTMIGVLPGFYNSTFGFSFIFKPQEQFYASYGIFDGNLARRKQTGIRGPEFNGSYFQIIEGGSTWLLGKDRLAGKFGVGGWDQIRLSQSEHVNEREAQGFYLFGSQRLWLMHPDKDNSGLIGFFQFGINNSKILPMQKFVGGGLSAIGLFPYRKDDFFGFGFVWAQLNQQAFPRHYEWFIQSFYQTPLFNSIYMLAAVTYIPHPTTHPHVKRSWAATARLISLF